MGKTKAKPAADPAPKAAEPSAPADLSPVQLHALGLLSKDAAKWRDLLEPGSHAFDFTVHLVGELHVGEAQTSTVNKKPDTETALARVFDVLGPKHKDKVLRELLTDPSVDPPSKQSQELAKLAITHLTTQTTQTKRGNVSGICHPERV